MVKELKKVSGIFIVVLIFNLCSVFLDDDLLSDVKKIESLEFKKIAEINVGKVFSNSFFFTSKKGLPLDIKYFYKINNVSNNEVIIFKTNTIKKKDSLYFFQHIDWVTKKTRKINSGKYILKVSNNNE